MAATLAIAYALQGLFADHSLGSADGEPRSLLAIAVQFGIVYFILNLRGYGSRFPQTLGALAGTGFIIGLLSLAILFRLEPGKPQAELALLYFGLFGWSLAVDAHIYRHALSIKMSMGVLLAVLIFAANFTLLRVVFG
jgi:hypothetical protein